MSVRNFISEPTILNIWNEGILKYYEFPNKLKLANVFPVYKKNNTLISQNV